MLKSKLYNDLKIILTILVVFAHITRMYTTDGTFSPVVGSKVLNDITFIIYQFHMPMFIMLSGMIFGLCIEKGKYKNKKKFVMNKMKRLLIPYFSFGFFYVTPIMILCKLTNQNYFEYIFDGIILAKNTRHLWYLLTLFIIFVIVILFQKIIKQYFNIILFILILISLYSYLFPTVFQISNVVHYLFYFVLGILINKKFETIKYLYFKTKRSILFILLIGLYLLYFFDIEMIFSFCLKLYMMILIFSLLIEINVLKNGQYIEKVRNTFFYKTIDKNSFGIYLFHPMIIYICFYIIEETSVNPYLFSFLVFVIGIMLSVILTEIIRKTKLHFCIGE